jgi:hypothetical protein
VLPSLVLVVEVVELFLQVLVVEVVLFLQVLVVEVVELFLQVLVEKDLLIFSLNPQFLI